MARSLLVEPRVELRKCRYTNNPCRVTIIAECSRGKLVGYAENDEDGTGALHAIGSPWVVFEGASEHLDFDWGFFIYLEDAFYATPDGGVCELPEDYEVR